MSTWLYLTVRLLLQPPASSDTCRHSAHRQFTMTTGVPAFLFWLQHINALKCASKSYPLKYLDFQTLSEMYSTCCVCLQACRPQSECLKGKTKQGSSKVIVTNLKGHCKKKKKNAGRQYPIDHGLNWPKVVPPLRCSLPESWGHALCPLHVPWSCPQRTRLCDWKWKWVLCGNASHDIWPRPFKGSQHYCTQTPPHYAKSTTAKLMTPSFESCSSLRHVFLFVVNFNSIISGSCILLQPSKESSVQYRVFFFGG